MERDDRDPVRKRPRDRSEGLPRPSARVPATHALIGNRAFARMVARLQEGDGIRADGTVHREIEAAIAATRGAGAPLPPSLEARFSQGLGASLTDVRVHADARSDSLARSVSARAFATGTDIFFAHGEYRPGTPDGDRLIAHELAHTEQQRGVPAAGPMAVSNPGDATEIEADAIARDLLA